MRAELIPQIRVTADFMSAEMISCMGLEGCELGEYIDSAIKKAIKSFDYDRAIENLVGEAIQKEITECLTYRGPAYESIREGVRKAVVILMEAKLKEK